MWCNIVKKHIFPDEAVLKYKNFPGLQILKSEDLFQTHGSDKPKPCPY